MDFRKRFIIEPGSHVQLNRIDPGDTGSHGGKGEAAPLLESCREHLQELQYRLYAENRRSLLIVLQGRDAAGKDGTIRNVLSVMNPQGCTVTSFKVPSTLEASHDFLWRCHLATPRRGQVGVFNRSHYEDVLVVRVHSLAPQKIWSRRYDHINAFEELLHDNQTEILKFFLHIDRDEQLRRFKKRLQHPGKQWKISDADYAERPLWDDYTQAYEEALQRCSTRHAPWFVIPSNHKWFRNLAIARIIVDKLREMDIQYPEPTVDLADIQQKYHAAASAAE